MEQDPLPISALQHLAFCPRQCALIHLEDAWAENRLTAEGEILHRRVQSGDVTSRGALRAWRALPLRSERLGLIGIADVVEILKAEGGGTRALPIEYKRGKPKIHDADRVQLCAQALCLEEMLDLPVPQGALYYGETRRREIIAIDAPLRQRTEELAGALHALIASARVPPARFGPHCRSCSLNEVCRPRLSGRDAGRFLERARGEL